MGPTSTKLADHNEVHCADGGVALIHDTIDRISRQAGEEVQQIAITNAATQQLPTPSATAPF